MSDTAGFHAGLQHAALWAGDILAAGAIIGAILGYLPYLAAGVGLVFYIIQIWESKTAQAYFVRKQTRHKLRRIERLTGQISAAQDALKRAEERLEILTKE